MAIGQFGSILGSHIFPATEGPLYMYVSMPTVSSIKLELNHFTHNSSTQEGICKYVLLFHCCKWFHRVKDKPPVNVCPVSCALEFLAATLALALTVRSMVAIFVLTKLNVPITRFFTVTRIDDEIEAMAR